MISVTLKRGVKRFFFDRQLVLQKADQGRIRALSRIGAFIMRAARRSIRKRKRASEPGSPPSSHAGYLREGPGSIVFYYDTSSRSVVVGPRPLNILHVVRGAFRRGTVPEVLEYGGQIGIAEQSFNGGRTWLRIDLRRRKRYDTDKRLRIVTIAARPYMRPAEESETSNPKLQEAWGRVVNNG